MIRLRTNVRQSDLSNVVALAMICRYQVHHDHCYVRQLDGAILVFCVAQFKLDPMVQFKVHFQGSNYVCLSDFNGSCCSQSQHLRLLLVVQTTMALSLTQILAGFFKNSDIPAAWFAICCAYNGASSQNVFRSVRRQCY